MNESHSLQNQKNNSSSHNDVIDNIDVASVSSKSSHSSSSSSSSRDGEKKSFFAANKWFIVGCVIAALIAIALIYSFYKRVKIVAVEGEKQCSGNFVYYKEFDECGVKCLDPYTNYSPAVQTPGTDQVVPGKCVCDESKTEVCLNDAVGVCCPIGMCKTTAAGLKKCCRTPLCGPEGNCCEAGTTCINEKCKAQCGTTLNEKKEKVARFCPDNKVCMKSVGLSNASIKKLKELSEDFVVEDGTYYSCMNKASNCIFASTPASVPFQVANQNPCFKYDGLRTTNDGIGFCSSKTFDDVAECAAKETKASCNSAKACEWVDLFKEFAADEDNTEFHNILSHELGKTTTQDDGFICRTDPISKNYFKLIKYKALRSTQCEASDCFSKFSSSTVNDIYWDGQNCIAFQNCARNTQTILNQLNGVDVKTENEYDDIERILGTLPSIETFDSEILKTLDELNYEMTTEGTIKQKDTNIESFPGWSLHSRSVSISGFANEDVKLTKKGARQSFYCVQDCRYSGADDEIVVQEGAYKTGKCHKSLHSCLTDPDKEKKDEKDTNIEWNVNKRHCANGFEFHKFADRKDPLLPADHENYGCFAQIPYALAKDYDSKDYAGLNTAHYYNELYHSSSTADISCSHCGKYQSRICLGKQCSKGENGSLNYNINDIDNFPLPYSSPNSDTIMLQHGTFRHFHCAPGPLNSKKKKISGLPEGAKWPRWFHYWDAGYSVSSKSGGLENCKSNHDQNCLTVHWDRYGRGDNPKAHYDTIDDNISYLTCPKIGEVKREEAYWDNKDGYWIDWRDGTGKFKLTAEGARPRPK